MNTAERAIPVPQVEIAEQRALRRQVLRHGPPLAARAENIKQAVENLAHIDLTPATAALGRRNQRLDQPPFRVRQIARIAQTISIVFPTVRLRPHRFHALIESTQLHGITSDSYHSTSLWTDTQGGRHAIMRLPMSCVFVSLTNLMIH